MRPPEATHAYRPVWRVPLALAALTVLGLVAGLLGDGWLDALSWLGLGIPALIGCWKSV